MIVKPAAHKRIVALLVVLSIVGVLFLLRMVFVLGLSSYMNAESKKENGNQEVVATYYMVQAFTGDFMEPYIAYYNAGTSLAKANQPELAEQMLTTSLAKVDYAYNECYIRNNLAKVQEQLGDYYMVSDMASTAETYYAKAITTISESPSVCFPPPPPSGGSGEKQDQPSDGSSGDKKNDPNGDPLTPQDDKPQDSKNGESMKNTEDRSKTKEQKAKDAQGESPDGKEKVEKEMDQSKSEMDNQKDLSDQQKNKTPNQVDKPW
jgi:hypothetical protein